MTENKTYIVRVPATTANIGSGFDTLGMSLGLYNVVQFVPTEGKALLETEISAEGEGAGQITSGLDNMIIKAMDETAKRAGKTVPGGKMYLINRIPFARGLAPLPPPLLPAYFLPTCSWENPSTARKSLILLLKWKDTPIMRRLPYWAASAWPF